MRSKHFGRSRRELAFPLAWRLQSLVKVHRLHRPARDASRPVALRVTTSMKKKRVEKNPAGTMLLRIERTIRAIPQGRVSTYGGVAKAAGFPGAARMVARVLRRSYGLPWQRVLGAGGQIKLTGDSAIEQRLRLEAEGVRFRGRKVDMRACEWKQTAPKKEPCRKVPKNQSLRSKRRNPRDT